MRTKLRKRTLLATVIFVIPFVGAALFVPLPRSILRRALRASSGWIITDLDATAPSGAAPMAKRLTASYLQSSVAAQLASRFASDGTANEAAAIAQTVAIVRGLILNQDQVRHPAENWPSLIAGLGWCDQINAAACSVLAHRYPVAQLYALYDLQKQISPHSIGRVWSTRAKQWLYFDGFFDRVVVFARNGSSIVRLASQPMATGIPKSGVASDDLYRLTGWVLNEYHATFGGYLAARTLHRVSVPPEFVAPPQRPTASPIPRPDGPVDESAFRSIAAKYLHARIEHLLGDRLAAVTQYRAVATDQDRELDWRAAELAAAAGQFALALQKNGS